MSELLAILLGIFLGISWAFSTVTEDQWQKAQELCSSNGGLSSFAAQTMESPRITCKNGAKFELKERK